MFEGEESGYSFDEEYNPDGRPAVEGATVRLAVGADCDGVETVTDEDGRFRVETIFPGSAHRDSDIRICFRHDEFEAFDYHVVYENTREPTGGNLRMNVSLVRKGSTPAD